MRAVVAIHAAALAALAAAPAKPQEQAGVSAAVRGEVQLVAAAAGLALFTGLEPGSSYLAHFLPAGVLAAVGLGFSLVPATIAAVQGVRPAARARAGSSAAA